MRSSRRRWRQLPLAGGLALAVCVIGLVRGGPASGQTAVGVGRNTYCQARPDDWTGVIAVAAGKEHTVGLRGDGTVVAVGNNDNNDSYWAVVGQCEVSYWWGITAIAAGDYHTVALKGDGTVVAVGDNSSGQTNVDEWRGIRAITAGGEHTVGLRSDGTVVAAGENAAGQCNVTAWGGITAIAAGDGQSAALKGDGTVVAVGDNTAGQCSVTGWTSIIAVAAGRHHTVGLRSDGTVVAVGSNVDADGGYSGQRDVSGWRAIVAIAAGGDETLGLRGDGTVVAVGYNGYLQNLVSAWRDICAIAAGSWHVVGSRSDGSAIAAGYNGSSQCNVFTWRGITAVATGGGHTVGLKADGTAVAVGDNSLGKCNVSEWQGITAIAVGSWHTVGLRADGTVVALGDNGYGQCNVDSWRGIIAIAAYYNHTLGLKSDGTVVATGGNSYGQCNVSDWRNIMAIATGYGHSVGVKRDGTCVAVGDNHSNQSNVSAWTGIRVVACGHAHTIGLKSDGTCVAVGSNFDDDWNYTGQCGVGGWSGITAIAGGDAHSVGLKSDGTVVAAGWYAASVSGWHGITAIAAAYRCTVAVKAPPGPPATLGYWVAPGGGVAGQTLVPPVRVALIDAQGDVCYSATDAVTLSLGTNPSGGKLSGALTVHAVNGTATFPDLKIDRPGAGYTVVATAAGLPGATSRAFSISGPPAKLVFTTPPANASAGAVLPVAVSVEDASGMVVPNAYHSVSLTIASGPAGATLSGSTTVMAVAGVATFADLSIIKPGTYYLRASAAGLAGATSKAFTITTGPPARLAFTVPPANTVAGAGINPAVKVTILDSQGNVCTTSTSAVTISMSQAWGVSLGGTRTVNAARGVATFTGLSITKAGTGYTLYAWTGNLPWAYSKTFNITAAAPAKLAFTVQPTAVAVGTGIRPAVQVAVQDRYGNMATTATNRVTMTVAVGPAGATLSGTTSAGAVAGAATFTSLKLGKIGTYYLRAASTGLAGATSTPFATTAGPARKLIFTVQPASTTAGATLPLVRVTVQDALGNPCFTATNTVTMALGTNPTATVLDGVKTATAVRGVATFGGLRLRKAGTGYALRATATGLTTAYSTGFDIAPAAAAKLVFAVQPASAAAGAVIAPAVKVAVQDRFGNACTRAANAVSIALPTAYAGTLAGTTTRSSAAGVATFDDLVVHRSGSASGTYRLSATAAGLTAATSSAFSVRGSAAPPVDAAP